MDKKEGFCKRHWHLIKQSIHAMRRQALVVYIIDLAFLLCAGLAVVAWGNGLKARSGVAQNAMQALQGITDPIANAGLIEEQGAMVLSFWNYAVFGGLLVLLAVGAIFLLSRFAIWHTILHKKMELRMFGRFVLFNLLWQPFNLVLGAAAIVIGGGILFIFQLTTTLITSLAMEYLWRVILYVLMVFAIFPLCYVVVLLNSIMYRTFVLHHKVRASFKQGIDHTIMHIGSLHTMGIVISAVFTTCSMIFNLLFPPYATTAYLISCLMLFPLLFTWIKYYLDTSYHHA